jgi:hypothetical protein
LTSGDSALRTQKTPEVGQADYHGCWYRGCWLSLEISLPILEKLLQLPKSLFKFSVGMIQTRKELHRPIELLGAKNVE